ncbi:hypothetical protein Plhal710r2_c063g0172581 [Plasmopara halstedii]
MSKMSARVQSYCKSFSGALYPQSLQDRLECGVIYQKMVSCLLQFGELEYYEAFLALNADRNKRQTLNSCAATQVVEASSKFTVPSEFTEGPQKIEESRLTAQIRALRHDFIKVMHDT